MPAFNLPLNLPHAATIAVRIVYHLRNVCSDAAVLGRGTALVTLLDPWREQEDNGPAESAEKVRQETASLARAIVDDIEKGKLGGDRLGQAIRNLFECLAMGEEGAASSLRAGENPRSVLRP
jgi:hypothetical protein